MWVVLRMRRQVERRILASGRYVASRFADYPCAAIFKEEEQFENGNSRFGPVRIERFCSRRHVRRLQ
jgi:hypothetical protein